MASHQWFIGTLVESHCSVLCCFPLPSLDVPVIVGLWVPGGVKLWHRGFVATGAHNVMNREQFLHVWLAE